MSPTWNFFNRSRQSTLKSLIAHSFDLLCLKSNLHMCWHIWVCDSCFCSDQSCDISGTIAFLPSQGVCKSITETTESPECISTLLMSGNQISGELPASLSLLTHLEVLEISSNRYCITLYHCIHWYFTLLVADSHPLCPHRWVSWALLQHSWRITWPCLAPYLKETAAALSCMLTWQVRAH